MMSPMIVALEHILDELIERIACRVVEKLRQAPPGMTDQAASPLGARRHCSIVRRRIARGEPGATIVGRKHLLSAEALTEELKLPRSASGLPPPPTPARGVRAELEQELRRVTGAK
jgi:hypothetical protein